MAKKKLDLTPILIGLLAVLIVAVLFNTYQVSVLDEKITGLSVSSISSSPSNTIAELEEELLPDEGSDTGYGLTYSTSGLQTMVGYTSSIELSGDEEAQYLRVGTTADTACEYCCGIGDGSFLNSEGRIACSCAHNIAFAGLTKHLIKEGYTDQEILDEIDNWKAYFFPEGYLSEAMDERGISPESVGLPDQRGGC